MLVQEVIEKEKFQSRMKVVVKEMRDNENKKVEELYMCWIETQSVIILN